jgi:DNA-binding response OmpR family regulator
MPGMSGLEAARAIRALPGWETTPILALTASAFEGDRRACRDAGMDDFIAKPIEPSTFYSFLLKWLEWTASSCAGGRAAPGTHGRLTPEEQTLTRSRAPGGARLEAGYSLSRGLMNSTLRSIAP